MNRYLVFTGENIDPEGGWQDFLVSSNEITDVKKELFDFLVPEELGFFLDTYTESWATIVDLETEEIVWSLNKDTVGEVVNYYIENLKGFV